MAPEIRIRPVDTWCELAAPHLLTGLLRMWLTAHFTQEATIEFPDLRSLLWTEAVDATKILIESVNRWRPELTEARPAILVKRNKYQILHPGINDELQGFTARDGAIRYNAQLAGTHTVFGISTEPGEAEIIGAEVYKEFLRYGPLIRKNYNLMRFKALELGDIFRVKESRDNWAVPVTLGIQLEEKWKVTQHAPVIKRLDFDIRSFI